MTSSPNRRARIEHDADDSNEHRAERRAERREQGPARSSPASPRSAADSSALIFHDPERPNADWMEEAETLPLQRRPALLSFHSVDALLDAAFPSARSRGRGRVRVRVRDERPGFEDEEHTLVRPDLSVSAVLARLNHVFNATPPKGSSEGGEQGVTEKAPDRSGVVPAVVTRTRTERAIGPPWLARTLALLALGVICGTTIALFVYGDELGLHRMEATVDVPARASSPALSGQPPPPAVQAAPIATAMATATATATTMPSKPVTPVATSADAGVKPPDAAAKDAAAKAPPAKAKPHAEKAKKPATDKPVTKVEKPPTVEKSASVEKATPPPPPAPPAAERNDKALQRERALAEAARKLAERQLSQSIGH